KADYELVPWLMERWQSDRRCDRRLHCRAGLRHLATPVFGSGRWTGVSTATAQTNDCRYKCAGWWAKFCLATTRIVGAWRDFIWCTVLRRRGCRLECRVYAREPLGQS